MRRCLFQIQIVIGLGHSRFSDFFRGFQTAVLTPSDLSSISPLCNTRNVSGVFHTYVDLLRQCSERKSLSELRRIHLHMKKYGFPHLSLGNKLIHAYVKCDSIVDARNLFDEMPQRHIVMWNSMISAYIRHGLSDEAIRLFERMPFEGVFADDFTFSSVFKAFSDLGLLQEGRKAHGLLVVLGLEVSTNAFVGSALVDMYARFGKLRDARLVSDRILEKDVVLMTALIVGCTQMGENGEALEIFRSMIKEGIKPNDFTFSSVLIACGNLGDWSIGKQIHGVMVKSGCEEVCGCKFGDLDSFNCRSCSEWERRVWLIDV